MSDTPQSIFPGSEERAETAYRPCLLCGASVALSKLELHFYWHKKHEDIT